MPADDLVAQQEGVVLLSQRLGFVFPTRRYDGFGEIAIESCGPKALPFQSQDYFDFLRIDSVHDNLVQVEGVSRRARSCMTVIQAMRSPGKTGGAVGSKSRNQHLGLLNLFCESGMMHPGLQVFIAFGIRLKFVHQQRVLHLPRNLPCQ